jgi:5-methylcytosine-specific restriction protein B
VSYYPEYSVAVVDSDGQTTKFRLMKDMFFHFKRGPYEHKPFRAALNKASDANPDQDTRPATLPFEHEGRTYLVHRIAFDDSLPQLRLGSRATPGKDMSSLPASPSASESSRNLTSDTQPRPQNLILFGPPGTGKTHRTVDEALRILDPALLLGSPDRDELIEAFNRFSANGQIVFTTFHQSFSYEDFVEGLRATNTDGQIDYVVEPGIFKLLCERAAKGVVESEDSFDLALAQFRIKLEENDGRITMKTSTQKVFSVTYEGGTKFRAHPENSKHTATGHSTSMEHVRRLFETGDDTGIYRASYVKGVLAYLKRECGLPDKPPLQSVSQNRRQFVLIVDEINRGNVSRIFGELITLIEPSRRAGMPEALCVKLPYSKEIFDVPDNLHIIGTMNTADRSLTGLDIALRRRFSFVETPPDPSLLEDIVIEGIDIEQLLTVINERIEVLLDRDHAIGHAYFMPLKEEPALNVLAGIFRNKIVPLLQEYFFEDWQRIQWVLNDHRKKDEFRFVVTPDLDVEALFGTQTSLDRQSTRWRLNPDAFTKATAYAGIIDANVAARTLDVDREATSNTEALDDVDTDRT